MNRSLFTGGILALGITAVHVFGGQATVVAPMVAAPYDDVAKQTMVGAWHAVTVTLFLSGVALLAAGLRPGRFAAGGLLPAFIGLHYALWGVLFVVVGLASGLPRPLLALPQWLLFLPVVVLCARESARAMRASA